MIKLVLHRPSESISIADLIGPNYLSKTGVSHETVPVFENCYTFRQIPNFLIVIGDFVDFFVGWESIVFILKRLRRFSRFPHIGHG
jgi:hypothetical protein